METMAWIEHATCHFQVVAREDNNRASSACYPRLARVFRERRGLVARITSPDAGPDLAEHPLSSVAEAA